MRAKFFRLCVSIVIIFSLWFIGSVIVGNELLLPGPIKTIQRLTELFISGEILSPLLFTALKALGGLSLALFFSLIAGFAMGLIEILYEVFKPIIITLQAIPIVSWLALAILWWGVGFRSPLYIVFLTLFPIITINITEGVRNVDKKLLEMARVFHLPKKVIFKDIYFASAIPFIISSLRISSGMMWKTVAVAEFMVGISGLGRMISDSKYALNTTDVFAITVLLVILGIISEKIFDKLSRRMMINAS
ncbi:MAG: ABC transporter permease [Kosmotogaceae bacterium]